MKRQLLKTLWVGILGGLWVLSPLQAQKSMTPEVYDIWKKIEAPQLSAEGNWAAYVQRPGKGDASLWLYRRRGENITSYARADRASFTLDEQYLTFLLHPYADTLWNMRKRKIKQEDLPQDSLALLSLKYNQLQKFPNVSSYKMAKEAKRTLAYLSKMGKETDLIVYDIKAEVADTFPKVKEYQFAEQGEHLLFVSEGDSSFAAGVYRYSVGSTPKLQAVFRQKGAYKTLTWDKGGTQIAFVADLDTTEALVRPYGLYYWKAGQDSAKALVLAADRKLQDTWQVSPHAKLEFSEQGNRLYWGTAPEPLLQDTTLLKEEIVNVEVWTYKDGLLYTQQENQLDREKKRAYLAVYDLVGNTWTQLARTEISETRLGKDGDAKWVLAWDEKPYQQLMSWEGISYRDVYLIDTESGSAQQIAQKISGYPRFSPEAQYVYWYEEVDTAWVSYSLATKELYALTNNQLARFYDELNDRPMHPRSYGNVGWLADDEAFLVYDRYDIWKVDPKGEGGERLTQGREIRTRYRYLSLDPEEKYIPKEAVALLHQFNESTKQSGYAKLDVKRQELTSLLQEDYQFATSVVKAKESDHLLFTKENFEVFPDLLLSDLSFATVKKISNANPQQEEYRWGKMERYHWTSLDGEKLEGLLLKPDDFDPNKKYPLLVNFYERSSHTLHRHRAPEPHRSTINYSYYVNKGYVIFNPDVPYRVGYPGESAYNAVIPGVTALIAEGFIDEENIGVQGHSWGGYQIAYLLTKTNIFKAAESGAPVVNMISAYGGIRWGSGLSRMFQYEHTQSRIGGTLWETPLRYIENSPIFFVDKIQTPVLILHNDNDGAVPWYQGIEFFVAMRRLGKPAWMLNYNDEPHWPLKLQNRKDFNLRMEQFFDHYLRGAPEPIWMREGVSPMQKGIQQNYETNGVTRSRE